MRKLARLLFFRFTSADYSTLGPRDAGVGVVCAWIAGLGRYWDHPTAGLAQKSGVGSVVYVFALSALLWLLLLPLRTNRQNYVTILATVSLTSPLAWLYALPVERWFDVGVAVSMNLWFLALVAFWRVGLLGRFLFHGASCSPARTLVLTLLPLCGLLGLLTALNLEHAVFELMASTRREHTVEAVNDANYGFVWLLTILSMYALVPVVPAYLWMVFRSLTGKDPQTPWRPR
jgi:hypothetical protein